jgi:Domain of unknown function DUF29
MSDLYDTDFLAWTEEQAALLRRLADGERVNNQVDWGNVIEEIESLGKNDLRAVRSLLIQAITRDLKAEAWPFSRDAPHWPSEAVRARQEAQDIYSPSMRGRPELDAATIYKRALRRLPDQIDDQAPLPIATECPFASIDEILADQ